MLKLATASIASSLVALSLSCNPTPATTPTAPAQPAPAVYCIAPSVHDTTGKAVVGASVAAGGISGTTNTDGYAYLMNVPAGAQTLVVSAQGFVTYSGVYTINSWSCDAPITLTYAIPPLPPVPTRDYVLRTHSTFQGLTVNTSQFGSLPWFEPALISLNAADRQALYAAKHAAGDTNAMVSIKWDYGEAGQPFGTGQLVPPADLTGNPAQFRALTREVIANGFTPVWFLAGDLGLDFFMANTPGAVAALRPQPNDPADLVPYGLFFICFDSCVPGWQPPTQVNDAISALRALVPDGYIAIEFGNGYPFWYLGQGDYATPAGQALDAIWSEFQNWPTTGTQTWQIAARLIGPGYVWPPDQPAGSDSKPAPWYLAAGTPRGPYVYHCFEYGEYPWVRGQISAADLATARAYYTALGCPVVD